MSSAAPPFASAELVLFGGLFTEAPPESLPQGASPLSINCDYAIGQLTIRPGKQSAFYYPSFFEEHLPSSGTSVPGQFAPNEVPWNTPQEIEFGTPGQYANVPLNQGVSISMIVQYQQLAFNVATTNFTASFASPVTAGNTVFIALFVHDPQGTVEGINLATITDNQSQGASHILATSGAANAANDRCFSITQSKALGGNQTYTFNLTKTAGGVITASTYAVCMVEITGTSNAGAADPLDQISASALSVPSTNFSTTVNVVTAQANELLIGVVQSDDAADFWPYAMPGLYYHAIAAKTSMQEISEFDSNGSPFQQNVLVGQFLPTNPNAILTLMNLGPVSSFRGFACWITLKMVNTFGIGSLGMLSSGPDAVGVIGSTAAVSTITLPTVTTLNPNEAIFYFLNVSDNHGIINPPPYPIGLLAAGQIGVNGTQYGYLQKTPGTFIPPTLAVNGGLTTSYASCAFAIPVVGGAVPWPLQDNNQTGNIPNGNTTMNFSLALTPGNTLMTLVVGRANLGTPTGISVSDSVGDNFQLVTGVDVVDHGGTHLTMYIYMAQNIVGGNVDVVYHNTSGSSFAGLILVLLVLAVLPSGLFGRRAVREV